MKQHDPTHPTERLSTFGMRSVLLCALGTVLLASFLSLLLFAFVAGPIGLNLTESLASRFNWLHAAPHYFRGEWLSAGTMSPIEADTENRPLALLRSAALEAAGPITGGYFLTPFPWLLLSIIHMLAWWIMLLLVLRHNGHPTRATSDNVPATGPTRTGLARSFTLMMAATAVLAAPLPALFMLVRMFWVGVSALDTVPLNTFGAGRWGLVSLVLGMLLIYGAVLRYAAGVVISRLRAAEERCPGCGYLCAQIQPCPECGRMRAEGSLWACRRRWMITLGFAALGAVLLLAPLWLSWVAIALV